MKEHLHHKHTQRDGYDEPESLNGISVSIEHLGTNQKETHECALDLVCKASEDTWLATPMATNPPKR
tara:strand:+ start:5087 stop:5287 length:201 start_codon:yes stop_codon:yes gene_type:complete